MKHISRFGISAILTFVLFYSPLLQAGAFERLFAPKAELWEIWQAHNENNTSSIDHSAWNEFLGKFVVAGNDGINRVRYGAVSATERRQLAAYLATMQSVAISEYRRAEQKAFWINLYNAATVDIILQHYPVASIRDIDISPGLFADGPWGKQVLLIEGRKLSLNDIEHRILRPLWKDPRIHYAVNCASLGCPNLQVTAYTPMHLDEQLDRAARKFIRHPRGMHITDDGVVVSSIFSWFKEDFADTEAGVIRHLSRYADEEIAARLGGEKFFAGDEYDWSLNDAGNTSR